MNPAIEININEFARQEAARKWVRASQIMLAAGVMTFVIALAVGQGQRAWQAYLLNFLFWTGIAQCGVIFSAAYRVSNAGWSDTLRRMGESLAFFLPVSLVLFVVFMALGSSSVFSWARQPYAGKEFWLNVPFVAARDGIVLLVLLSLSVAYVYHSQRTALRAAWSRGWEPPAFLSRIWARHNPFQDDRRWAARTAILAPALLAAFALGFSLLAFDLVMSLDPHWHNTLFGWYFFAGACYSMLAFLAVASAALRSPLGIEGRINASQSHDLGKLLFGFCLLTGGFFWAQWLVFWYGNLPEEIAYVIRRYYSQPFAPLAWVMTFGAFIVPMVLLLSKRLKREPRLLMFIGIWVLCMLWLERYIWIVPAIWQGSGAPMLIELAITAGFFGGFVWGWIAHNRNFPLAMLIQPVATAKQGEAK